MKLEISNKRETREFTNEWKLNNTLLNNQCVKEEIKKEIKNILKQIKVKTQHTKIWGM